MKSFIKITVIHLVLMLLSIISNCQIKLKNQKIFVESFLKINDNFKYSISQEKYFCNNKDTLFKDLTLYNSEISIIDTINSIYTLQWINKKIVTNSQNEGWQLLVKATEDIPIIFQISKGGSFDSIKNWKVIKDTISNRLMNIPTESMSIKCGQELIQLFKLFNSSRENIETYLFPFILQTFKFHGNEYKFKKKFKSKSICNTFFNSKIIETSNNIYFDSINIFDKSFKLSSFEKINEQQISEAINEFYKYFYIEIPISDENYFSENNNSIVSTSIITNSGITKESKFIATLKYFNLSLVEINNIKLEN